MTLVLGCATRDYVVQVSDRRLTSADAGAVIEDNENKSVLFDVVTAFAYTGPCRMEGKKTDLWLAEVLQEAVSSGTVQSGVDILVAIKDRATRFLRRTGWPAKYKRLAVFGVGWAKPTREEPFSPRACLITNFEGYHGTWLEEAEDKFKIAMSPVFEESEGYRLWVVGQQLLPDELAETKRNLRNCVARTVGPRPAIRILTMAIRRVACRNSRVGKNLMVVCLPNPSISKGSPILASRAMRNTVTCEYISEGQETGEEYLPNVVYASGTMFTGYKRVVKGDQTITETRITLADKSSTSAS